MDIEALDSLIEENRENYTSSNNNHNNNHKKAFGYPFGISLKSFICLVLFVIVVLSALAMYPLCVPWLVFECPTFGCQIRHFECGVPIKINPDSRFTMFHFEGTVTNG